MKYQNKGLVLLALLSMFVSGCTHLGSTQQQVVDAYVQVAGQVSLGMDKAQVKQILSPSQQGLEHRQLKQPDQYKEGQMLVKILYFRSGWQPDGITTDDEFTPYVFNDDVLVAIGWATLDGPKTQGQARPRQNIYRTTVLRPAAVILQ
ncbi:MAG: DUF3192 domain-containing protein [Porticoccaceae bacterium]|nr:DUF3192 domain-containing protein [Porticoccaceae bacterium]